MPHDESLTRLWSCWVWRSWRRTITTPSDSGFCHILHGGAAELVQNEISPSAASPMPFGTLTTIHNTRVWAWLGVHGGRGPLRKAISKFRNFRKKNLSLDFRSPDPHQTIPGVDTDISYTGHFFDRGHRFRVRGPQSPKMRPNPRILELAPIDFSVTWQKVALGDGLTAAISHMPGLDICHLQIWTPKVTQLPPCCKPLRSAPTKIFHLIEFLEGTIPYKMA